jgi:hypothetical protein
VSLVKTIHSAAVDETLVAKKIVELAKGGKRNPDLLCERALTGRIGSSALGTRKAARANSNATPMMRVVSASKRSLSKNGLIGFAGA